MRKISTLLFILLALPYGAWAIEPFESYLYAVKDGEDLYLDYYPPASGSQTTLDGIDKPSIIFIFGGGFKGGKRNDPFYDGYFTKLTENGYPVFSIDYRLGLKNATKAGVGQVNEIYAAIQLAVEDLYSATAFILDNALELGVDPNNLVIAGSSAGAITALQAEWQLVNSHPSSDILPENFRYKGVMSFSGAILSNSGKPSYKEEPCPTLMLHGTADKIVNYKGIAFFKWNFSGTDRLTKTFLKNGYNYNTYRYKDHGHDVATFMEILLPIQIEFLENNVMKGEKKIVDTLVDDPDLPVLEEFSVGRKKVYAQ